MKMSTLNKIIGWLILSSLLLVAAACAAGGVGQYSPPKDPMRWQMWQDNYGGSSG